MSIYLTKGTLLAGRFTIIKVLGRGGTGITYLALDQHISRQVAIKELFIEQYVIRNTDDGNELQYTDECSCALFSEIKSSFLEEARVLSRYHEEAAIVNVLDYFEENETAYLVMEYISGGTLLDAFQQGNTQPSKEIFNKMLPVMRALKALHDDRVLHLDISPSNLVQNKDGNLKLIDFGSVSLTEADNRSSIGVTDGYAPVEQWQGTNIGPWTDIYALCAVIYTCLTGKNPTSSVQRALLDDLKTPSQCGIEIEKELEEILVKGMAVQPEDRYRDLSLLIRDIEKALRKKPPVPLWKKMSVGAVAILCCMGVLWGWNWYQKLKEIHKFDGIETVTAVLIPDREVSARDFGNYLEAITNSVSILSGAQPWDVCTNDEGQIRIKVTKAILSGGEAMKNFSDRLVPSQKALIADYTYVYDYKCMLSDEDIESVEICTGFPENYREDWVEELGASQDEAENYRFLKVTLSEDALPGVEDLHSFKWFLLNHYDPYRVMPGDKDTEFYILGIDQEGTALDVYAGQIMEPLYDGGFEIQYEFDEPFETQEGSPFWGEWQIEEKDLEGEPIDLTYICSMDMKLMERNEDLIHIKERFDTLKIPYAFRALQNGTIVTIRVSCNGMCRLIPELLGLNISYKLSISDGVSDTNAKQLGIVQSEEGGVQFTADFEFDDEDSFLQFMKTAGRERVYLMIGGNILGSCSDLTQMYGKKLVFDPEISELCQNAPAAEQFMDYLNGLKMFQINADYIFLSGDMSSSEKGKDPFYSYTPRCIQELCEEVKTQYPEMNVLYKCDNSSSFAQRGEITLELQGEDSEELQEEKLADAIAKADRVLSCVGPKYLPAEVVFSYQAGERDNHTHVSINFYQEEGYDENYEYTGMVDRYYSVITAGKHVYAKGEMVKKIIDKEQLFKDMRAGMF